MSKETLFCNIWSTGAGICSLVTWDNILKDIDKANILVQKILSVSLAGRQIDHLRNSIVQIRKKSLTFMKKVQIWLNL